MIAVEIESRKKFETERNWKKTEGKPGTNAVCTGLLCFSGLFSGIAEAWRNLLRFTHGMYGGIFWKCLTTQSLGDNMENALLWQTRQLRHCDSIITCFYGKEKPQNTLTK